MGLYHFYTALNIGHSVWSIVGLKKFQMKGLIGSKGKDVLVC